MHKNLAVLQLERKEFTEILNTRVSEIARPKWEGSEAWAEHRKYRK